VITSLSAATYNVSITDNAFSSIGNIMVGDIVIWTNNGTISHTSTGGSGCTVATGAGAWDSGTLAPAATFPHTFTSAGSFPYHCTFHCSTMVQTITVTAATGIFNPRTSLSSLTIFPNPFTDVVTLSVEQGKVM